ncbi:putative ABC transport system permease protein [Dysgonomonas hofstadii]|uniref:Putative ABC transport system permease protein n=1 Tax=Dysgonomonas hofstadii TaxID=637886 RepID=A0A840CRQ9_9BACT|nr:ABC transporter permease [Dysgonomonas hofstadii]MBB4035615.1 putative ABC transport system permease protein [Dysgonomonas hofstadii]
MYKIYFKQAIEMLKQNKFISLITIIGTALAIMMIMVIIVAYSIKNASISPEVNRNKTLYLKYQRMDMKDGSNFRNRNIAYSIYKNYLLPEMKTPEMISVISPSRKEVKVRSANISRNIGLESRNVDDSFWKIMSFDFVAGKPFTKDDLNTQAKKVILTESTASELFGSNDDIIGKEIQVNFKPYIVSGVIKDVSPVFEYGYSDLFLPYPSEESDICILLLKAKNKKDFDAIRNEVRNAERRYNAVDEQWTLTLFGPYDHKVQQLDKGGEEPNVKKADRKMIFIILVLLLIPAINMSGISISRIKRRTEEIGIRKTFGAKKSVILIQVLYENFITTLTGGFIGLVFSYFIILWFKRWLLGITTADAIPVQALISVPIVMSVFVACLLLNILSAGVPAYKASRMKITDSLNRK